MCSHHMMGFRTVCVHPHGQKNQVLTKTFSDANWGVIDTCKEESD